MAGGQQVYQIVKMATNCFAEALHVRPERLKTKRQITHRPQHGTDDLRDPFRGERKKRYGFRLMELDAWVDSGLFRVAETLRQWLDIYSHFVRRFRVRGPVRAAVELSCDGLTFGLGGLVLMLFLAQPAFEETKENWRASGEYSVTFLDRYGNEIGKRGVDQIDAVPLKDIPDHLIKATLATEDRRFFGHFGIDILGTARAMFTNLRSNAVVQGGSTLTQQLAKNLFLTNERTLQRKIKEAFLALWLEANLTKREILKLYLDRAYMGGGTFGVAAAAEFYFNKSIRDITLAEAAMLAGLYKAPTSYAPHVDLPAARARANEVLSNMVEAGFMTEGEVIGARRNPAKAVDRAAQYSPDYFLDWAFEEVKRIVRGRAKVLVVRTTLDLKLQKQTEAAIEQNLRQYGEVKEVTQAAAVAMEPAGAVRAMVGGRDYGKSQFNRATDALRQPGSSFKPYVYMAALMNEFTPDSIIRDEPITIKGWTPRNYSRRYRGPVTLKLALAKSINTVPVRLATIFGREKVMAAAYSAGIRTPLKDSPALPLGTSEVTVLGMAGAYSTFANDGRRTAPYAVDQIADGSGNILYKYDPAKHGKQVLPKDKVEELNTMLHEVTQHGTGGRARLRGIAVAGKTGTTQSYRDAWFIGFTGNFVGAVWYGNDNYQPTHRLTGGNLPAMTWQAIMEHAHDNIELKPIPGVEPIDDRYSRAREVARLERLKKGKANPTAALSPESEKVMTDIANSMRRAIRLIPPEENRSIVSLKRPTSPTTVIASEGRGGASKITTIGGRGKPADAGSL